MKIIITTYNRKLLSLVGAIHTSHVHGWRSNFEIAILVIMKNAKSSQQTLFPSKRIIIKRIAIIVSNISLVHTSDCIAYGSFCVFTKILTTFFQETKNIEKNKINNLHKRKRNISTIPLHRLLTLKNSCMFSKKNFIFIFF